MIAGYGSDWVAGGCLTDWISLGVLASWVPAEAVEATGKNARRRGGKLPPRVVAYLVMSLALFADEDYEEAVHGQGRLGGVLGGVPTSGGIAQPASVSDPSPSESCSRRSRGRSRTWSRRARSSGAGG
jgi:hypothetical protein